jgi:hypothetical protein
LSFIGEKSPCIAAQHFGCAGKFHGIGFAFLAPVAGWPVIGLAPPVIIIRLLANARARPGIAGRVLRIAVRLLADAQGLFGNAREQLGSVLF